MQSLKIKSILQYLMLILIIVPVIIVGVIGFFSISGFANSTVEQYAKSIGTAQGSVIDQALGQYERDIFTLSLNSDVYNIAASATVSEENQALIEASFDGIIGRNEGDVLNFV